MGDRCSQESGLGWCVVVMEQGEVLLYWYGVGGSGRSGWSRGRVAVSRSLAVVEEVVRIRYRGERLHRTVERAGSPLLYPPPPACRLVADVKHGLRRQVEQLTQPRDAFSLAPDIHPAVVAAVKLRA